MPVSFNKSKRPDRVGRLIAKLRSRQLRLALDGRVMDSARYARLARRVRRASGQSVAA